MLSGSYVDGNYVARAVYDGQAGFHESLSQIRDVVLVPGAQLASLVALEHLYAGARAVEHGGRQ